MKIFDWVHRKFHNKDDVSAISHENVKMINKAENDRGALPLETLDEWGGAEILTIGTFGFDRGPAVVNDFKQQLHFHIFQNEEKEEEDDDENVPIIHVEHDEDKISTYPLVLNASKHGFGNNINNISNDHEDQNSTKTEITLAVEDSKFDKKIECKRRERVTLADLFSADSQHHTSIKPDKEYDKLVMEAMSIEKLAADHDPNPNLQFSKKFMKEDSNKHSQPIKKIHRMMRRMLKKKIHPELEGRKQKKENQTINCAGSISNEVASLLQTQDAVACA